MKEFYDHKPDKYEPVGNGSFRYRWNIEEITTPTVEGESVPTQWCCDEIIIWAPVTKKKLTQLVITTLWSSDYQLKLQNEYNSATLNLYDDITAEMKIRAYTDFLVARDKRIKAVEDDCSELNILD